MEEKLNQIFLNINEWLKFSEAKNAALIALIAASLWGTMQIILTPNCNKVLFYYSLHYSIFSGLGLIVALFSFLPQTKITWPWRTRNPKNSDNLLFYGHLERYDENGLIDEIERKYALKSENKNIEYDLANQIIQNSKIAMRKYRYFSLAIWFVIMGFLSFPITIVLYLLLNPNE